MRIKLTRYIPDGYKEFKPELEDYPKNMFACYVNLEQPHNPRAIFFTGKQSKSTWHYRFPDIEQMKKKINESISNLMSWEDTKAERKENRKKDISEIKVGDLFVCSWGYDQTNVDFYQVVDVKGKTFTIRAIAGRIVEGSTYSHGMADMRVAVKDAFLKNSEPIVKRSLKMNSYSWLSKTTEKDHHYCSWYA